MGGPEELLHVFPMGKTERRTKYSSMAKYVPQALPFSPVPLSPCFIVWQGGGVGLWETLTDLRSDEQVTMPGSESRWKSSYKLGVHTASSLREDASLKQSDL